MRARSAFLSACFAASLTACVVEGQLGPAVPVLPAGTALQASASPGVGSGSVGGTAVNLPVLSSGVTALKMGVGQGYDLGPSVSAGGQLAPPGLVWTSSDGSVANVDPSSGRINAVAPGSAVITAAYQGSAADEVQVTVTVIQQPAVSLISISPAHFYLNVGNTQSLIAEVDLPDGEKMGNGSVLWSSSDNTVAMVNQTTGVVTALKPGVVTVVAAYAPDPDYKAIADLTVLAAGQTPPPSPTPAPVTFGPGATPVPTLSPVVVTSPTPTIAPTPAPSATTTTTITAATQQPASPQPTPSPTPSPAPSPQWSVAAQDVADVSFSGSADGLAASGGDVLRTTDGGATWTSVSVTPNTLYTVDLVGSSAWAGDDKGNLYLSSDGGLTWALTDWPGAGLGSIYEVRFKDSSNGYLSSEYDSYFTSDGGHTWTEAPGIGAPFTYTGSGTLFLPSGSQLDLLKLGLVTAASGGSPLPSLISFVDSSFTAGWGVSQYGSLANELFRTSDGGSSWTGVDKLQTASGFVDSDTVVFDGFNPLAVGFSGSDGMLIASNFDSSNNSTIMTSYTTSDGGSTWQAEPVPLPYGSFGALLYFGPSDAIAELGAAGCILEYTGCYNLYRYAP